MNKYKKLFFVLGFCFCSISTILSPIASLSASAMEETTTIEPREDNIEWRFKIENGKLYRRLYNYSIGIWIGDWEYVGEVET